MTSFSEDQLLPISSLRQMIFCPRIPWFLHVLSFQPPAQAWMAQGKAWHATQHNLQKRRIHYPLKGEAKFQENVYVSSNKLKLHGYLDELVCDEEECVVIEYKSDQRKPYLGQRLQLLAYVVAVEESLKKRVVAGILLKGSARKQYKIDITAEARNELYEKNRQLRDLLSSHRMPFSNASPYQCDQCEYLRYCNDR